MLKVPLLSGRQYLANGALCCFHGMKIPAADALELSVPERIQLVIEIWDSIAECPEQIELTEATRQLLRKRLAAYRANPDAGSPWEDVNRRILNG